jgi:hypothetical protein
MGEGMEQVTSRCGLAIKLVAGGGYAACGMTAALVSAGCWRLRLLLR